MIFTIGHSTRSAQELVGLLRHHSVDLLVDVRRYPGSRRHPQFNRDALAGSLRDARIAYRHAPELGGRRGAADAADPSDLASSPNAGWRNASFRAYADYMGTATFREALDRLAREGADHDLALMCAEAVPWRCHRNLISDGLVARGIEVRHITSSAAPKPHQLNPLARPHPDGSITYPAPPPDQHELF